MASAKPYIEGGATKNHCAAACRGEAAIANDCNLEHGIVELRLELVCSGRLENSAMHTGQIDLPLRFQAATPDVRACGDRARESSENGLILSGACRVDAPLCISTLPPLQSALPCLDWCGSD